MCYKHKVFYKFIEKLDDKVSLLHGKPCQCPCAGCVASLCKTAKWRLSTFMEHSLCAPAAKIEGSKMLFFNWNCINLQCNYCWLNRGYHVLNCTFSKWDSMQGMFDLHCFPLHLPNSSNFACLVW